MRLKSQGLLVRPVIERVGDFNETIFLGDEKWARYEASRCLHCYNRPACQQACPAGNDISQAMLYIEQGKFLEAAQVYRKTTTFPEICGRVCPQEKLCEGACVRNRRGDPVPTGALEAFVTEYERRTVGYHIPVPPPTGCKVAIVGGGPSGLACAEQLARMGHWVTIFDNHAALGGALTYGFPSFKLPRHLVTDIIKSILEAGVTFVPHTTIGKKTTVNDLFAQGFESIFLGMGSGIDQPLDIPGEKLPGVYFATDFLVRTNVEKKNLTTRQRVFPEIGDRVVVIGGGDPATDCARTAIRLGARNVTCLYRYTAQEIPGRGHDRQWAEEEGVEFRYLTIPQRLTAGEKGHVAGVDCVHVEIGEPDSEGARHPHPVEGTEFHIRADTVIVAAGYYPDPIVSATTPGLLTHKWGLVVGDPATGATSRFGVYTGGDIVTGPDMVVNAMLAGRKAAYTIDAYLS
ncbi:MAG: NAD(P)-dependent oxidoreductase [Anaerolineales bacterium]|nr:NAD(P)-dependent oxidoreductase [Anaerolineales bacterium]